MLECRNNLENKKSCELEEQFHQWFEQGKLDGQKGINKTKLSLNDFYDLVKEYDVLELKEQQKQFFRRN